MFYVVKEKPEIQKEIENKSKSMDSNGIVWEANVESERIQSLVIIGELILLSYEMTRERDK